MVAFQSAEDVFAQMKAAVNELGPSLVPKVKGVITFDIQEAGQWTLDLKNGSGTLEAGTSPDSNLTVSVAESDFLSLAADTMSPQQAFMKGKIKVKGNMALAMKLKMVFDATRTFSGATAPAIAPAKSAVAQEHASVKEAPSKLKSALIFAFIGKAIVANGAELVKKTNGVFQFHITTTTKGEPDGAWLLDLKNGSGSLTTSSSTPADITITISDDDFVALSQGKLTPQMAYMRGKLKIKGKMGLAMKLGNVLKASARPRSKL